MFPKMPLFCPTLIYILMITLDDIKKVNIARQKNKVSLTDNLIYDGYNIFIIWIGTDWN